MPNRFTNHPMFLCLRNVYKCVRKFHVTERGKYFLENHLNYIIQSHLNTIEKYSKLCISKLQYLTAQQHSFNYCQHFRRLNNTSKTFRTDACKIWSPTGFRIIPLVRNMQIKKYRLNFRVVLGYNLVTRFGTESSQKSQTYN